MDSKKLYYLHSEDDTWWSFDEEYQLWLLYDNENILNNVSLYYDKNTNNYYYLDIVILKWLWYDEEDKWIYDEKYELWLLSNVEDDIYNYYFDDIDNIYWLCDKVYKKWLYYDSDNELISIDNQYIQNKRKISNITIEENTNLKKNKINSNLNKRKINNIDNSNKKIKTDFNINEDIYEKKLLELKAKLKEIFKKN